MKEIRVLLADDHALIRSGIRALLEKLSGLQIVAEARNGPEALRLIKQHQPDVALIESAMSRLNGFEVTARVSQECPDVHVIIVSERADEKYLKRAFSCGAAGYLAKTASAAELELAVMSVANGETHVSAPATKALDDFARRRAVSERFQPLTPRQREVLTLMAEGHTTKQIAQLLNISFKTVETHRLLLTNRLNIHDIAGLVRYAIKAGLIRLMD